MTVARRYEEAEERMTATDRRIERLAQRQDRTQEQLDQLREDIDIAFQLMTQSHEDISVLQKENRRIWDYLMHRDGANGNGDRPTT